MIANAENIHLTIQEFVHKHEITSKKLEAVTGYTKTPVYDLIAGRQVTLPIVLTVLPALWELTGDSEILLTGRRPAVVVAELPNFSGGDVDVRIIVEHTRKFSATIETLADIFADGKVDGNDKRLATAYGRAVDDLVNVLVKSKHSLQAKANI